MATTTSRREFHRSLIGAAAALALPSRARARAAKPAGRFIDVHTHLGRGWNNKEPLTALALLRWMDAHDVSRAAVLPVVSPEASSYPVTSDMVLAETAPHRDRLVPFCSIDPRSIFYGGKKGLVEMLKRYIDAGAKGFGEHKAGVRIDSPKNLALFAACAEVKLPVLIHLDNERNIDAPGLPGLAKVLAETPALPFIGHGPGWWASISRGATQADLGGYPRGGVFAGGALDTLMDKYPNLYGDLSAGSGANAIRRDLEFGREFLLRRADRLMFGTDFLSPDQDVPQFALFDELDLPEDVEAKICRENARRVLQL